MLFIRFYETNEAGPCGVGGGQCIPTDWWNLLTLHYNWAGFLLLGPSHPWDTPQPPGDQGLVRTVNSSQKSEPQSLVPKRRHSSARKGSDISGAQSVSGEDVTMWRNRPTESELRVWHQLRGLGSSSRDKHPYFHLDGKNHSKSINQLFNLYIPCNQHHTMLESEDWIQRHITHGPWSQRFTI